MQRSRFIGAALASTLSCRCGVARAARPSVAPLPAPSPAEAFQRIDTLLQAQIQRRSTAGVTVVLGAAGRLVYVQGYGQAQLEPAIVASPATRYRIGSLTKQFTAAAILLLAEAGQLGVDDRLARYIPEYGHGDTITLRQLLNQCSGLPSDLGPGFESLFTPTTPAKVIAKLNGHPLNFEPGTRFENAHLNYYLLGVVLERVAAMPYGRFVQERIAAPLALNDTFLDGTRPAATLAAAYNATNGRLEAVKPWSVDYTFADGGLVSTAPDLLKWNVALRSGGLLKAASWRQMTTVPQLSEPTTYAMGLVVNDKGKAQRIWHNGLAGGAHAMNAQYRDVDYDVIVLANTNGPDGIVPEALANVIVGIVAPTCAFARKGSVGPNPQPGGGPTPGALPSVELLSPD